MMQNPRKEENSTTLHVLYSCLHSGGERKRGDCIAADAVAVGNSRPSLLPEIQVDDATGPDTSSQQMTSIAADAMAVDNSHPSLLPEIQMDDATGPDTSSQQKKLWTVMRKTGAYWRKAAHLLLMGSIWTY